MNGVGELGEFLTMEALDAMANTRVEEAAERVRESIQYTERDWTAGHIIDLRNALLRVSNEMCLSKTEREELYTWFEP